MKKIVSFVFLIAFCFIFGQQKGQLRKVATIGFMNVENLWDTIASADYIDGTKDVSNPAFHRSVPLDSLKYLEITEDYRGEWRDELLKGKKVVRKQTLADDFTYNSAKNWNTKNYNIKIANQAKVISEMGAQYTKTAPVIVGLIEVENRQVIEDLIKHPLLAKYDYGIIHYNSYDARGIDVAIIYQKRRFTPSNSLKKEIKIYDDNGKRAYTRDIVVATGFLDNEKVAIFMNHWPARSGGEARSLPRRNAAAKVLKQQMDSVRLKDPSTKLFAMGDFNDDPVNTSLKNILQAVGSPKELSPEKPYLNLMYPLFKKGVASLAYQDAPNLFDQIIVSGNLISDSVGKEYSVYKTEVFAPPYLITREGPWKNYPLRSWSGDTFTGGYSDHFPAFVVVQREAQ
ncbi:MULTISPECIES: endonuclease [unclassified Kaistella]|uniref:endonuclease/exonuclease/phosphatase family protein n=1 Tax=unclassified Kaistella TaxID=2762626 RepID=UPI0027345C81|nr:MULTISPECIES: endonuclease [unclassified Kaistella]MDP2454989.1 endonuclease [Kaistella sp. SH11-4b]MDP2456028.1 endonuclease [Kaistella sp. SH40-3]MDP2460659.1 endonuclease [Kaistella sp. SH19-2b]